MKRLRRWVLRRIVRGALALVVAVGVVVGAVVYGPGLLQELDFLRVRTVEVSGTRFLEPYAVVSATAIDTTAHLFDDRDAWRDSILALPLVEAVEIRRRLPSTLAIDVREVEPVALIADGPLVPVDARGRVLPIDPAGAVMDLPVVVGVERRDGGVVSPAGRRVLRVLVAMRTEAPTLVDRISQVEVVGDGREALRLLFREGEAEALLPAHPSRVHLRQLRLAYADLAARGELSDVHRIDLRFSDQVVVSFLASPVS